VTGGSRHVSDSRPPQAAARTGKSRGDRRLNVPMLRTPAPAGWRSLAHPSRRDPPGLPAS
jgi:hypothetical protein